MEDIFALIARLDADRAVARLDRLLMSEAGKSSLGVRTKLRLIFNFYAWCLLNQQKSLLDHFLSNSNLYDDLVEELANTDPPVEFFDDFIPALVAGEHAKEESLTFKSQHPVLSQLYEREGISFCFNQATLGQGLQEFMADNPNRLIVMYTKNQIIGVYVDEQEKQVHYYNTEEPFALYSLEKDKKETIDEIVANIFENYHGRAPKKSDLCSLSLAVYDGFAHNLVKQEKKALQLQKRWRRNKLSQVDQKLNHALQLASIFNHTLSMNFLLQSGGDVNATNINRVPPIYYAAAYGNEESVDLLLKFNPNLSLTTRKNIALQDILAICESASIVDKLSEEQVFAPSFRNPLCTALQWGRVETASKFANMDISHHAKYGDELPPMQMAIQKGETDIVNTLIDNGNYEDLGTDFMYALLCQQPAIANNILAHVNSNANIADAILIAIKMNAQEVVEKIIEGGFKLNPSHFAMAIRHNRLDIIEKLQQVMGVLGSIDFDGEEIIQSLQACSLETLKKLLDEGLPIDFVDNENRSLLWHLVDCVDLPKILAVLPHCDAPVGDYNPLTLAVEIGSKKIVALLIKVRGLVDAYSDKNVPPLVMAFRMNNISVAKVLIEHGADLMAANESERILELVVKKRSKAGFQYLKEINFDFSKSGLALNYAVDQLDWDLATELVDLGVEFDHAINGMTPLQRSVLLNNMPMCEKLIALGANLENTGTVGYTPLGAAIRGRHWPLVDRLLELGSKVNVEPHQVPPVCTASQCNFEVVKKLLSRGANVNIAYKGFTPLHFAIKHHSSDEVEKLLSYGADVFYNKSGEDGVEVIPPLLYAVNAGEYRILEAMIGAMTRKQKLEEKETLAKVIYQACKKNDKKLIKMFLENDLSFNLMGDSGYYPIHALIRNENEIDTHHLIERGVDVNVQNDFGVTPLHFAMQQGNIEIIEMLLAAGASLYQEDHEGTQPLDVANADKIAQIKLLLKKLRLR